MKVKEESEKVGLKLNIQKTKIRAPGPITSWQIDGETMETVTDFIFLSSKKTIYFCFIDYVKAFDYVDHNKLWKIPKEMVIPDPPDLPFEKPICRSGSNSYNWTWINRLVPNRKRSTSRLYIVTLLI